MGETAKTAPGSVIWVDLTVPDAGAIRDFYSAVVGWRPQGLDMGGYDDFNMIPPDGDAPAAGICHARGENADLPPQWLVYITVADLDESVKRCLELGGQVIAGPRLMNGAGFCVIRDPAGAAAALYAPAASETDDT
jgi:predicted enzyme related to lactoylglutathione lyase